MSIKINRLQQGYNIVPVAEDDLLQLKAGGQLAENTIYCVQNRLYVRTTPSELLFIGVLERVAALPPNPKVDRLYYNLTTQEVMVFNGSAWEMTPASTIAVYQTAESEKYTPVIGSAVLGRIQQLEGRVDGITNDTEEQSSVIAKLIEKVQLINEGNTLIVPFLSAAAVTAGSPVGIDADGRAAAVTAGSKDEVMRYIGVAVSSVVAENIPVRVQTLGVVTLENADFSPGLPVYVNHTASSLTQTDPLSDSLFRFLLEAGIALTSQKVLLRRSNAVRLN